MRLSLKAGERIFVNGAVLRSERRVTLELLNDATFLLEAHVMQLEDATTPLRQLYFIIQSMLINPASQHETRASVLSLLPPMQETYGDETIASGLADVRALILEERPFEALRVVRGLFPREQPQTQALSPDAARETGRGKEVGGEEAAISRMACSRVA
ncbi:flagellar biosynthesis repressor FlbT [Pseudochelatococcus sp. B33]